MSDDSSTSPADPILSLRDVRVTFHTDKETVRAVDGVSFALERTGTLGIVGESGSGKSVTARSILGLVDEAGRVHPDGEIRYHDPAFVERIAREYPESVCPLEDAMRNGTGEEDCFVVVDESVGPRSADGDGGTRREASRGWVDLVSAPPAVVRSVRGSEIAMVSQNAMTSLNPVYTVGNQIRELLATHRSLRGSEATDVAADLLESVGIPDPRRRLKEYPHQFSGGMKQRAVIALALACDPTVLVCDEPTTALDVTIQAQIVELLERLQRERDLSIVFITHDMGVIARIADAVTVMYAGEVLERAPVEALFEDPKHPYTCGLLESIPGHTSPGGRLPTIDGSVPTPTEPPAECRYAPRCPEAFDACWNRHPASVPVESEAVETAVSGGCEGASTDDGSVDHCVSCLLYPETLSPEERRDVHRMSANEEESR
ncbi:ABC transporter ATP-binding protein [Natrarchaeobius sp. A-rgal3]|uniref:ABC transporter ATP-binding protein n=1 Tax=Natrarchaeobius versutus TaxID=1679078 RepID=UPI00350F18B5